MQISNQAQFHLCNLEAKHEYCTCKVLHVLIVTHILITCWHKIPIALQSIMVYPAITVLGVLSIPRTPMPDCRKAFASRYLQCLAIWQTHNGTDIMRHGFPTGLLQHLPLHLDFCRSSCAAACKCWHIVRQLRPCQWWVLLHFRWVLWFGGRGRHSIIHIWLLSGQCHLDTWLHQFHLHLAAAAAAAAALSNAGAQTAQLLRCLALLPEVGCACQDAVSGTQPSARAVVTSTIPEVDNTLVLLLEKKLL